jgi:hypothetical protein
MILCLLRKQPEDYCLGRVVGLSDSDFDGGQLGREQGAGSKEY